MCLPGPNTAAAKLAVCAAPVGVITLVPSQRCLSPATRRTPFAGVALSGRSPPSPTWFCSNARSTVAFARIPSGVKLQMLHPKVVETYLGVVRSLIRSVSASIANGLVRTCMPGSRCPYLGCIPFDPAVDRRMVDRDAALAQHLLEIAVAHPVAAIPTDSPEHCAAAPVCSSILPRHARGTGYASDRRSFAGGSARWPIRLRARQPPTVPQHSA